MNALVGPIIQASMRSELEVMNYWCNTMDMAYVPKFQFFYIKNEDGGLNIAMFLLNNGRQSVLAQL